MYVFKAIKSQNEEDKKKLNNYYSILLNAYLSLENTKNVDNLICEYTNQFKNSFEDMISKLKKIGFKSNILNLPVFQNINQ